MTKPLRTSFSRFFALSLFVLTFSLNGWGQLFQQDFSSSTTVASYASASSPTNGQFNAIGTSGSGVTLSINTTTSNKLRFAYTGSNAGSYSRTTAFSGPPTTLMYRFDLTVSGNSSASTSLGTFQVGSSYGTTNSTESNANTYARFAINTTSTAGQFSIRDITNGTTSTNFTSTQTILWVLNNTASTTKYRAPDNSNRSLPSNVADLWVGTTNVLSGVAVQTTSQTLSNLKFVITGGSNATFDLDNFLIDPIPATPTSNAASPITSSGFTANWTAVSGVTGYRVDVATDNAFASMVSGYNNVYVSGQSTSSLAVTGLSASTPYFYRVRGVAQYTVGEFASGNSSTQNPTTISACTAPSISVQPTVPTATCSGTGTQTLSVTAAGTGLNYSWGKGGVALVNGGVIGGQGTATVTLTGPTATNAGNYDVTVTGTCGSVTSTSVAVTVNTAPTTTPSCTAPSTCQGNTATITGAGSTGATTYTYWNAATTGTQYTTGSGYTVSGGNLTTPTSLTSGTYPYYVQGENSCGASASRQTVNVTVTALPTSQATGLTYTATSATAGTLSWTRGTPSGGTNILVVANSASVNAPTSGTAYTPSTNVALPNGTTGTGSIVVYNSTGTSQAITGLTAGTAYTFAAYEFNSASNCYMTTSVPTTTTPGTSVSVATLTGFAYVNGSGPSSTQTFTLTGTKLSGNITVTAPTDYEISSATATVANTYVSGSTLTFTPSSGSVSATITVRLKAGLAVGSYNSESITCTALGANSSTVTCSGTVTVPVPVVTGDLTLTATQWSAYTYNVSATNSPTGYSILSGSLPTGLTLSATTGVISGTPTATGTFNFTVKAANAGGNGSAAFQIVVSACSPAAQASGATVSALTGTTLTLTWTSSVNVIVVATPGASAGTAPSQGTTYSANASYTNAGAQTLGSGKVVYSGSANTVNITSLTAGTQYTFAVYAYNSGTTCYNTNSPSTATVTTYCTAGATSSYYEYISNVSVGSISNSTSRGATYNDYTSQSTYMVAGNSYSLSVTNGDAYNTDEAEVWVDWDRNGVFGNNANEIISLAGTPGGGPYTATLIPPAGASTGSVRMRVRLDDPTTSPVNATSCGNSYYGEVEDYTINVIAACTVPVTQASAAACTTVGTTSATISWTRGSGTGGVVVVATPTSGSYVDPVSTLSYTGTGIAAYGTGPSLGSGYVVYNGTGTSVAVTGLTQGTQYTFRVYEYNSGTLCYNTTSPASVTVTPYCSTTTYNTAYEYINTVKVASTTYTNSNTNNYSYNDYTARSFAMTTGTAYSVTVTEGSSLSYDQLFIWVDWNNNGDFTDAGELMYTSSSGSHTSFTTSITPPAGAYAGNVRMRIRLMDDNGLYTTNSTPCGVSSYGEVEDYTVNVTTACTPPATQASGLSSPTIGQTTATLSIGTRGSGNGVILVAYPGASVGTTPSSGTSYTSTANVAYGTAAAALGTGYVVYSGSASAPVNVNVTSLTAGTQYTFVAYEYATTGTCYNITTTGTTTFTTAPSCTSAGLSPSNGATGVCYSGTGAVSSISWTAVSTATTYDVYFGTSASPPLVSTAQAGVSYSTGTLSAGTTYYWKVVPKNAGGSATGCSTYSFITSGTPCYCTAGAIYSVEYISNVNVGTINYTNPNIYNTYNDYTAQNTSMIIGNSYNATVKAASGRSTDLAFIWVDWNNNGVFGDVSNEIIATGGSYSSYTATITPPSGAYIGGVRMRIRIEDSYNGSYNISGVGTVTNVTNATSCGTSTLGEVEDYTINVVAPCTPPSTQASAPNFTMTSASTGTLSWTKGSAGEGVLVAGSTGAVTDPTQGTSYTGTTAFATGATTASGSYVLFSSTSGTSVGITGLTAATNFSIYEYNSSTNCYKTPAVTAVVPVPVVTGTTITGTVGTAITTYSGYATNYPTTYSYTGSLPAGLSFSTTTGAISGIPTATSSNVISVTATNIAGPSASVNITFNISACPATQLVFTTQPTAGQNISEQSTFNIVVTAQCSSGYVATGLNSGSVTINFSGCGLYLGSTLATGGTALSANFSNGVATFTGIKVGRSAQSNVSFTTTNAGTSLTLTDATSNTFNIIAPSGSTTTTTTVASNDFEGTNPTPWLYNNTTTNVVTTVGTGGSNGSDITGTKTYNGNTFLRKSYSVNNGSGERGTQNVITFDAVSGLSSYTYVDFTFNVASSTGLSNSKNGRGDDQGEDFVMDIKLNGSSTWTTILTHTGFDNKYFDFATSPVSTLTSNSNTVISASNDQSAFKLTLPSGTSSFQFRITATNNRLEESWDIDNLKLVGTTITGGTPTALPSVSVTGGDLVCGTSSTTLSSNVSNAQGAVAYSWSPTTGLSSPSVAAPTASPTGTVSYNLTITDAQGCKASPPATADVNLIIPQIVLPTVTTASGGYCDAADGFRYYQVSGSSPATYFFAIKWDSRESSTVKNAATVTVTYNATAPFSSTSTSNLDGSVLMRRYWNVNMNGQTFTYQVDVKFYYDPTEKTEITTVKDANKAAAQTASGQTMYDVPFKWFKTVGRQMDATTISLIHGNNFSRFSSISLADANSANASTDGGILYARFNSVASFSGGTGGIGFTNSNSGLALPVTLLYLNATPKDNSFIELDWATASEINNKGFEIERSKDGVSYDHIGWVDGHGNSNAHINYTLNDKGVEPDVVYYYRLKQVDIDGRYEYSNIVSASIMGERGFIMGALVPNPASNQVAVNVVTDNVQTVDIMVTDMLGREVLAQPWQLAVGANGIDLDISALSQGVYHVTIRSANSYFTKVLAVTR